ncbi:hypothetical protein LAZ67_7001238 [Cordylochernes scorpioides]|uniref:CCHC-type domain-containing protein n=1 Tax=Cordylochernes scorpioides TaxID=51811 RepID=A0ABY6KM40_9ARAC|nr:hypothetical protein LAZ67_7001238 [Cordylochernes scorpioides]
MLMRGTTFELKGKFPRIFANNSKNILSHISARLEIKSKGVTSHVYVTYGIKCSLCHKQGHKRSNCPRKTSVQEASLLLPGAPLLAQRTPEEGSPPPQIPFRLSHQRQPQVHHRLQHQLQLHHQPHLLHRPKIPPL